MIKISSYVSRGGKALTCDQKMQVLSQLPLIREKIKSINTERHPNLPGQLGFFLALAGECHGHIPLELPPDVLAEILFALSYCLKTMDFIPDTIPDIGYADDAAVVEEVLRRRARVLAALCIGVGFNWQDINPEPAARSLPAKAGC